MVPSSEATREQAVPQEMFSRKQLQGEDSTEATAASSTDPLVDGLNGSRATEGFIFAWLPFYRKSQALQRESDGLAERARDPARSSCCSILLGN